MPHLNIYTIEYIRDLALERKQLVIDRTRKTDAINETELIAQSTLEVELFDSIDSLTLEEFSKLFNLVERGGLIIPKKLNKREQVEHLFFQLELGMYITKGIEKQT